MYSEIYTLIGVAVASRSEPCFGIPIFRHENYIYIQEIEDEKISHFREISLDENCCVNYSVNQLECVEGMTAVYAFSLSMDEIFVGSRRNIKNDLKKCAKTLQNKPFLSMDIFDFIGDLHGFSRAFQSAERRLLSLDDTSSGRLHRALDKRDYKFLHAQQVGGHEGSAKSPFPSSFLRPGIVAFGIGSAGGNAINSMIRSRLEGVEFIVADTDPQAMAQSRTDRRIRLGTQLAQGLGSGARPDIGRSAAEEAVDEIVQQLAGTNIVFITAGMGGGTGTGAAPVIAQAAREQGILTIGVVTTPFHFEGQHRGNLAEAGIKELSQCVDTLIVIPNQSLFRRASEDTTFADAFKMADDMLYFGVRVVTDLLTMPGLINLELEDIRMVMSEMGKAVMGAGEASGKNRASEAADTAIANAMVQNVSIKGARGLLMNITGGMDMTLFEIDEAANRIRDAINPDANIIFGSTFEEELQGKMRVSVIATGIDSAAMSLTEKLARVEADVALTLEEEITRVEKEVLSARITPQPLSSRKHG